MSEYDYLTSSCYTNFCRAKGYVRKLQDQAYLHRMGAYRIHQSLVQKPLSIDNFWQIGEKEEVKIEPMTKERWERIKEIHGLKK